MFMYFYNNSLKYAKLLCNFMIIIIISLYMLYIATMMSVLEVLTVTVPVLLTVAFITIAERKTMASMQRRLGPNAVGHTNSNITFKRFYHSSFGDLREL